MPLYRYSNIRFYGVSAVKSVFSPDHFVDDADVGLDDLHDLVGDVEVRVIRHWDCAAGLFICYHLNSKIDRLQQPLRIDAREDKAGFVQRLRTFGRGPDTHGGDRMTDGSEKAALLRQCAAVRHYAESVHLQAVVVMEAKRLMRNDSGIQLKITCFQHLS